MKQWRQVYEYFILVCGSCCQKIAWQKQDRGGNSHTLALSLATHAFVVRVATIHI